MELDEFYRRRIKYDQLARENAVHRLNKGDDSPFWARVIDEMLMDMMEEQKKFNERLETLESLISPDFKRK